MNDDIFWQACNDEDKLLPLTASILMGLLLWRGRTQPAKVEPPCWFSCCILNSELLLQEIRTEEGETHSMWFCLRVPTYIYLYTGNDKIKESYYLWGVTYSDLMYPAHSAVTQATASCALVWLPNAFVLNLGSKQLLLPGPKCFPHNTLS